MRTKGKTRQRRLDARIEMRIRRLIDEGLGAPQIVQELDRLKGYVEGTQPRLIQATTGEEILEIAEELGPLGLDLLDVVAFVGAKVPDERTIRRRIAEHRPTDTSGPWTWTEADGDEAALILPVLGAVMEHTDGRATGFTKDQARWVAKVRRAAPDLDAWYVWKVAVAYQVAVEKAREADRASLDAFLAFAPWRSRKANTRFALWAIRHRPGWWASPRLIIAPKEMTPLDPKEVPLVPSVAGLLIAQDIFTPPSDRLPPGWARVGRAKPEREEESNESPRKP